MTAGASLEVPAPTPTGRDISAQATGHPVKPGCVTLATMIESAAMKSVRSPRASLAWMLLACILLNGLVCALGHGQMLARFTQPLPPSGVQAHAHHHHDAQALPMTADMAGMHAQVPGGSVTTLSPTGDCVFAATLLLITLAAVVLQWLLRPSDPHRRRYLSTLPPPPRARRSALHPQAP